MMYGRAIFAGVLGAVLTLAAVVGVAVGMGYAVKSLAMKKGYTVSFAWGFFFGVVALLYWGLAPVHPELQANIIAEGIRRSHTGTGN